MDVSSTSVYGGPRQVHFRAPPAKLVEHEMKGFIDWFNRPVDSSGLVRVAIATYYFLSIHPFEDGNGRVGRAIADLAIAQSEQSNFRLASISERITSSKNTNAQYYELLVGCQRGERSIEEWVIFFLTTVTEAAKRAEETIDGVLTKVNGKVSDATAKRDLLDLKAKGILISIETSGRNAGYKINPDILNWRSHSVRR